MGLREESFLFDTQISFMHTVGWGGGGVGAEPGCWWVEGAVREGSLTARFAPWRCFLSDDIRNSGGLEKSSCTGPQMLHLPGRLVPQRPA